MYERFPGCPGCSDPAAAMSRLIAATAATLTLFIAAACGIVVNPDGNGADGESDLVFSNGADGESDLVFSLSSPSGTVQSAYITLQIGSDVLFDPANDPDELQPVALPWEHAVSAATDGRLFFFQAESTHDDALLVLSDTASEFEEQYDAELGTTTHYLVDASVDFFSDVSVGDWVLNASSMEDPGDGEMIAWQVLAVEENRLTLTGDLFPVSPRQYAVYGTRIVAFGRSDAGGDQTLQDEEAGFLSADIKEDAFVCNYTNPAVTTVAAKIDESTLSLDDDIFEADGGEAYAILEQLAIVGITTASPGGQLVDTSNPYDFRTKGLDAGAPLIQFTDPGEELNPDGSNPTRTFALVSAVVDRNTIDITEVDEGVFGTPGGGDVYLVCRNPLTGYARTYGFQELCDVSIDFGNVDPDGVVVNTHDQTLAEIADIISTNRLGLSADIFPPVPINYEIYAERDLAAALSVDGEMESTQQMSWWSDVSVVLSGSLNPALWGGLRRYSVAFQK
jgi:hypothetical protein